MYIIIQSFINLCAKSLNITWSVIYNHKMNLLQWFVSMICVAAWWKKNSLVIKEPVLEYQNFETNKPCCYKLHLI